MLIGQMIKPFKPNPLAVSGNCLDCPNRIYNACLDKSILILIFISISLDSPGSLDKLSDKPPPAVAEFLQS